MSIVFLIGMPASGKSYWGEKVAQKNNLPFIDLDKYIEEQEKTKISGLFSVFGEEVFREKENKYLNEIIFNNKNKKLLLACGGGTPCFYDNIRLMNDVGTVIYLKITLETIIKNINTENNKIKRPLLQNIVSLESFFETQLQKRQHYYEQAKYSIEVEKMTLGSLSKIVNTCINRL